MVRKLASRDLRQLFQVTVVCLGCVIVAAACGSSTSMASSLSPSPVPSDLGGMAVYHPSSVVSRDDDRSIVLRTSDSVDKVASFYADTIKSGGWQTLSSSTAGGAANFTVKRNGKGVAIAISPAGSETSISISAYPTA